LLEQLGELDKRVIKMEESCPNGKQALAKEDLVRFSLSVLMIK
jgi:hypothetical protein